MPTTQFFAGPPNAVDGYCGRSGVDQTLSAIRAGAGTGTAITNFLVMLRASGTSSQWQTLQRELCLFDTSAISSGNVVTAATFNVYSEATVNDLSFDATEARVVIVTSSPASDTSLANSDYANVGSTDLGHWTWADIGTGAYESATLNASGVALISTTGITKLGARGGVDFDNSVNPAHWSANQYWYWQASSSDHAGTSQDPYLEITYEAAATFAPSIIMS